MNIKEAINTALLYFQDIFESERVENLGLEEIEYDSENGEWIITVGFSRPWDIVKAPLGAITSTRSQLNRSYKTLRVRDSNKEVTSIKNRAA